ncbi:MAG: hypothetical protein CM1200mP39_26570 [Dehalococcoidia bacterium]|nr:MAG: hypothetical protein CM1200mP39_26570 [Dehalococcoidia bacterium]
MELTNGIGADKVIEVVGFPAVVEEGLKMVRMRGVYLEVGHISPNSFASIDVSELVKNQVRFYGIQHYDPWIIPNAIDFLERTSDKYPLTRWFPTNSPRSNRQGIRNSRMVRYPGRQRSHSSRGRPIINFHGENRSRHDKQKDQHNNFKFETQLLGNNV